MKKLSTIALIAAMGASASAFAVPITVAPIDGVTITANSLANSLLSGASGITINSVTYTGDNIASGTFADGGALGLTTGIVLTSGSVNNVPGPNNAPNATLNNAGPPSALLSSQIGGTATNDSATLEINFTPTGNQIQFSYVFGSEEYNEFLGFNDVFGFFVNGVNFAFVPGTTTPVSVSNLNCGSDGIGPDGPNCSFFINNPGGPDVQYDGFTQILSFTANVNAGVENTLTLAIADASDSILDTGVFIAGGSLQVCGDPPLPPCDPDGTVPEPGTMALLGLGLLGLRSMLRKRS